MQIGVVGVGRMVRFHARFRSGLSAIDRIVLADANDQRAGHIGAESASFPEMVEDVDDVVITASTSAHPELIMHCVAAGKPSFCEKPISIDLASSYRVVDYVREPNGQVRMGFQRGFDPGHRAAHELVESGGLGDLYPIRMADHDPEPSHEDHIRIELHGSSDNVAVDWDDQIPLHSPLALHAARAGRPRHRSHPRCARANQIHRVVSARTGCRSGQKAPIGHQPSRGGVVEFAISESKGSDAMDASDTSGVARHRTQEGGKQC